MPAEQSSTFATPITQLRADAETWPSGLIMCDRDTFITLCDIAKAADGILGAMASSREWNRAEGNLRAAFRKIPQDSHE